MRFPVLVTTFTIFTAGCVDGDRLAREGWDRCIPIVRDSIARWADPGSVVFETFGDDSRIYAYTKGILPTHVSAIGYVEARDRFGTQADQMFVCRHTYMQLAKRWRLQFLHIGPKPDTAR